MIDGVMIFDTWATEVNQRVQVWRLPNGDIKILFVDTTDGRITAERSLTAYRADDLARALEEARP